MICPYCEAHLGENPTECPSCGAQRRRDKRGLLSGSAFLIVATNVVQDSVFFGILIGLLGVYGFSTLRNFRWLDPKT